uniref:Retrotransposon gag domain-containing protein n=1 Tax=Arundo donax TaxID=35708 RepID=A0A0A9F491_ARUDO
MAKAFVLSAKGIVLTCYSKLSLRSICSWAQLRNMLTTNFQGSHKAPVLSTDLHNCKQEPKETLRDWLLRFNHIKCQTNSITSSAKPKE